jgi:protein-disulfide isomerase
VLDKYPKKVNLVFKNYPLGSVHPFAYKAAVAALAAHAQGEFWKFHNTLFENYRALNDAKIQAIAKELKLDMERFNGAMKDPSIQKLIVRDIKEGQQAGIEGIPAVFINGQFLQHISLQDIGEMIEAALKKSTKR